VLRRGYNEGIRTCYPRPCRGKGAEKRLARISVEGKEPRSNRKFNVGDFRWGATILQEKGGSGGKKMTIASMSLKKKRNRERRRVTSKDVSSSRHQREAGGVRQGSVPEKEKN